MVGQAGLGTFPIVAMLLFFAAFVGIVLWTFLPRRRREMDEAGRMPLEDEREGPKGPGAGT